MQTAYNLSESHPFDTDIALKIFFLIHASDCLSFKNLVLVNLILISFPMGYFSSWLFSKVGVFGTFWKTFSYSSGGQYIICLQLSSVWAAVGHTVILHHQNFLQSPTVAHWPACVPDPGCESWRFFPWLRGAACSRKYLQKISLSPPTGCVKQIVLLVKSRLFLGKGISKQWPIEFSQSRRCWSLLKVENTVDLSASWCICLQGDSACHLVGRRNPLRGISACGT